MNYCRVAGRHFKAIQFYTTLPPAATAHMETLICDHRFRHPPCIGRDANGVALTQATAAYTNDMVAQLVSAVSYVVGSPSVMDEMARARRRSDARADAEVYAGESAPAPSPPSDGPRYLLLARTRCGPRLVPVRQTGTIDTSAGTVRVSSRRHSYDAPLSHLRPYVASLENRPWSGDARAFTHEAFVMCDIANCDSRATHSGCENSSSSCRVCSAHCTCFNHDAKCFTSAPSPTDECFLGAHKLRLFWERTRDIPEAKADGIEAIGFDDRVPPEVRERVWAAIVEHRHVFESAADGVPLAVAGGTYSIKLKSGAKPYRCPEPTWGHGAKRDILTRWAKEVLANGMFVHCPHTGSRWASRIHIALKAKRGSPKDSDDFGIRICGDYKGVNDQCQRLVANAPNVP